MPEKQANCFKQSKAYQCMCQMPSLRHTVGEEFDIETSEAVQWLLAQPEIKQYVFNKANVSGAIIYDPESGSWSGVDA